MIAAISTIFWTIVSIIGGLIVFGGAVRHLANKTRRRWSFVEALMADSYFWDQKDFFRKTAFNLKLRPEHAHSAYKMASLSGASDCVSMAKVLMTFYFTGVDIEERRDESNSPFDRWILKLGVEEAKIKQSIFC